MIGCNVLDDRCLRHATIRLTLRRVGLLLLHPLGLHGCRTVFADFQAAAADVWHVAAIVFVRGEVEALRRIPRVGLLLLVTIVGLRVSLHFPLQADAGVLVQAPDPGGRRTAGVILQNMFVEAIGMEIHFTEWALVDISWLHDTQRAQVTDTGNRNRHCAWFDVAGRCLAAATATGLGNKGSSSNNMDIVGGTRILHTMTLILS